MNDPIQNAHILTYKKQKVDSSCFCKQMINELLMQTHHLTQIIAPFRLNLSPGRKSKWPNSWGVPERLCSQNFASFTFNKWKWRAIFSTKYSWALGGYLSEPMDRALFQGSISKTSNLQVLPGKNDCCFSLYWYSQGTRTKMSQTG